MILAAMASAGIPGMVGFIAEFLVFRGSFPIFPIQTLLCLVASGLTAVYFLLMINRVFFGRLTPELSRIPRSTWPERFPEIALALFIIVLGLQPSWMIHWSENQASMLLPMLYLQLLLSYFLMRLYFLRYMQPRHLEL